MVRLLDTRFHEKPVSAGLEASGRIIELFTSLGGVSWTLLVTTPGGDSCVIAVGEHWVPAPPVPTDGT